MKTTISTSALLLAAWLTTGVHAAEPARAPSRQELVPTAAEREARLAWWRDARFGMFIHWGVYSDLSGTWNGRKYGGYGEHIQRMAKIPIPVYHKEVAGKFNPTEFNADEWIQRKSNTMPPQQQKAAASSKATPARKRSLCPAVRRVCMP